MISKEFTFERLDVYQKALDFVNYTYKLTKSFPPDERFLLIDQMRRASTSIVLNISEGYGKSQREFKHYLNTAKGSVRECLSIGQIAKMQKYITQSEEDVLRDKCVELSKMVSGLISSLKI